jgi:hypothetical protein
VEELKPDRKRTASTSVLWSVWGNREEAEGMAARERRNCTVGES